MTLPTLAELESAAALVYGVMQPTPQVHSPLLSDALGIETWIKHENHTPVGAFKVRGGIVYVNDLRAREPNVRGLVAATRGNHGQSIALAGRAAGLPVLVVVPHGNSVDKNAAMRALGAELIEAGHDFQASLEHAQTIARERGWHMVPSFDTRLVAGVGTYALELFRNAPPLDAVYVPIGLGSGACGVLAARNAVSPRTEVIGVVSDAAPAYAAAFLTGTPASHDVSASIADGMACRTPVPASVALLRGTATSPGLTRVVTVSDDAIADAMRRLFGATHNVAEGAGAAALAALVQERETRKGQRVAVVLTGGNVDRDMYARVLAGANA